MRRISILVTVIMLFMSATFQAFAAEHLTRTIESFDFFIDTSSSMRGGNDSQLGKVLRQINEKIPNIAYPESGIHTFAPEDVVLEFQPYDKSLFAENIDKLMNKFPSGKNSSLGNGFDFYAPVFSDMLRKGAIIVFTDGNYGNGRDSLNEAKIFYLTQPEMCLHFVSFAGNDEDQKRIDDMAAISPCSVSVKAADLVDNAANTEDFVRRVFYGVSEGDTAEVGPAPVIDFVMLSIPFGFDSDKLDTNTAKVADALAERLKSQPDYMLKIDGYTCNIGSMDYNLGLSKRRAEAVKRYITNIGVEPSRISTEGFGLSNPYYDNNTREGRSLNRRVEFTFFTPDQAN